MDSNVEIIKDSINDLEEKAKKENNKLTKLNNLVQKNSEKLDNIIKSSNEVDNIIKSSNKVDNIIKSSNEVDNIIEEKNNNIELIDINDDYSDDYDIIKNDKTIPLKVLYHSLKKHKRNHLYFELFYYIIYLGLFIYLNLNVMNIPNSYRQNEIIYDHFLDEEFQHANYKKTFMDVGNFDEYWEWLDGPFFNGFYNKNYVMEYNYPVGGLFIRQTRIKRKECNILKNVNYCYNEYNNLNRYGGKYLDTVCETNIYPKLYGKDEHQKYYGNDGCVIFLPFNKTIVESKLKYLKDNNWIDLSTRSISIYFNLYNSNTKLLTNGRFMIEFFPSGFLQPSYRLISMPFRPDGTSLSFYIVGFLFSIGFLYFVYVEIMEYRGKKNKLDYIFNKWNIIECFNLCLFLSVIVIFLYWKYNINKKDYLINMSENTDSFDYYYNSYLFYQINVLSAFCCLVSFIKVFKYLRLNRRLKLLWDTLSSAFADLFSMMIVSLLIISGFALTGNLIFGQTLREFKSYSSSVSMLLRSLLGDFDYRRMAEVCPNIAPVFFLLYIFIVFFVITNMFVAVVCEYFQKVNEYSKEMEKNKNCVIVTNYLESLYIKTCHIGLFCCCSKKEINHEDIQYEIKRRRFAVIGRRKTFTDLWKNIDINNNNRLFEYFLPEWRTMGYRYRISRLFDKINIDDYNYKKLFKLYENSNLENLQLNLTELNKITNNDNISNEIVNIYYNNFKSV